MSKYSWGADQVLHLLGIPFNANLKEQKIICPICGGKNLTFNLQKDVGNCWNCGNGFDSRSYYSIVTGCSLERSGYEIEEKLGLRGNNPTTIPVPPRIVYKEVKECKDMASPEVLNNTYQALISCIELSEKNRNHLKARGLTSTQIEKLNYRTLPTENLSGIAKILGQMGCQLDGVPGFYHEAGKSPTMVRMTGGIMMPRVNRNALVTGIQIRKDDDLRRFIEDTGKYEEKCAWFSSSGRENGTKQTVDPHYACDFTFVKEGDIKEFRPLLPNGKIFLTEGIMKGDIIHFCSNAPVLCVPGVNQYKLIRDDLLWLKEKCGLVKVVLAYDMDYKTNPNVKKFMEATEELIRECGLEVTRYEWNPHYETEDGDVFDLKGLDDYLVLCKYGILPKIKIR